jgi:hypothetical protein
MKSGVIDKIKRLSISTGPRRIPSDLRAFVLLQAANLSDSSGCCKTLRRGGGFYSKSKPLLCALRGFLRMIMMVVPVMFFGKCRHSCAEEQNTSQYSDNGFLHCNSSSERPLERPPCF